MFYYRKLSYAKLLPFFSTVSFAAIFCLVIFAGSFISDLSPYSAPPATKGNSQNQAPDARKTRQTLHSILTQEPPLSLKEEVNKEAYSTRDHVYLVPPFNVSHQERTGNLPDFGIFKSTRLTRQFGDRVQQFFGSNDCKLQFFMTWISPASSFQRREFLAVESLFKAHPHGCLIILSRTVDSPQGQRILKPLQDHGYRVLAVAPDLYSLFKNTPVESWFEALEGGHKDPGKIPLAQNLSNVIRLAVLYKYGGVYLDADFLVLKAFTALRNSIGAQSIDVFGNWTRLNNALLVFDKHHPLLYEFLKEFASTFDGNRWGHNGPYLVSRVVQRIQTRPEFNCTILPPMAFYPVGWTRIDGLFAGPKGQVQSTWVEAKLRQLSRETYALHLWNRKSSRMRIEKGSIIGRLISRHSFFSKQMYSS